MHSGLLKFKQLASFLKIKIPDELVSETFKWISPNKTSYASDISDNHVPYEFSISNDGSPEIRLLFEVQGDRPSLSSNYKKACLFNEKLVEWGASLDRFDSIKELYRPTSRLSKFGLWHAYCFRNDADPDIKIYLNPQAHGESENHALTTTAVTMSLFGFGDAYLQIPRKNSKIKYLSLDLTPNQGARLKIYSAHYNATAIEIEEALSGADNYLPGQVSNFCKSMGITTGPYNKLPVQTCLSFTEGYSKPTSGAVHFPIRCYAENDLVASNRLLQFLGEDNKIIPAVNSFLDGVIEKNINKLAYVSLRQYAGPHRTTVYLSI
jgi:hypothetical protein